MARLGTSTVVFVHPMNVSSVATAVAWEPQTIDRKTREEAEARQREAAEAAAELEARKDKQARQRAAAYIARIISTPALRQLQSKQ